MPSRLQAVIVCISQLLTPTPDDRILSEQSFGWVDALLCVIAVAWVLPLGASGYVLGPLGLPAGAPVALVLLLVVEAVVGLLMVVMRALLRQATTLRNDLEGVI